MAAIDELKNLLSEDVRELDALADTLATEKEILGSADVSALEAITEQKNAILEGIRDRAKQKIRLLINMGYKPDAGAPSRFIRASGLDDLYELYELWTTADSKLRFCQSVNENNGRVVGHLQKRLGRLTDIFRGASAQQKLYGAKGQQTGVSSRTMLASA